MAWSGSMVRWPGIRWLFPRCLCGLVIVAAFGAWAAPADGFIYWPNGAAKTIGRANLDGGGVDNSFVTTADGACGVASDGTYVYWTGGVGTGHVGRASLNTRVAENTFIATQSDLPCGVAVDSAYVYFNNYSVPAIGRATKDGSSVNQSFISGGSNPQHPSVDGTHVYWSNKGFGCPPGCTIGQANVSNGSGANQSFVTGTHDPPGGTATDGAHVYWGNGNTIGRVDPNGSGANGSFITTNGFVCGLAVDSGHIYWAHYGDTASGGRIGRANLDGTGVNDNFIVTAGNTCGVAVDSLTSAGGGGGGGSGGLPPAPSCAYGNPDCATTCTNQTTLLVTCPDLAGDAGLCQGVLYPQCLHPVVPRTICESGGVCTDDTPGGRPAVGSCASMGQALPECNAPRREVPTQCHSGNTLGLAPQPGQVCWSGPGSPGPITNCPPPSSLVTPACTGSATVRATSASQGATATATRRRGGIPLTVTVDCPKVLAKPRCRGTIAVDGLRSSLLRTLTKQAQFSAGTYRFFVPGLAAFAGPFEKKANAITRDALGGTKLPKAVGTAAIVAKLGRSDPQTKSYAASLQRAVNEYRKLAGRPNKRRGSKRAEASRTTTTFKRFSLNSSRKRVRIRIMLSAATVQLLRRDAANRGRAPVRVIVSFKATPRPVVRFVDLALAVR